MSIVENQLFDSAFPIKIGKQKIEFQTSMLTDRDYGDLDLYLKARYIELIRNTATNLSDEARKEVMSVAVNNSLKIGWATDEGIELIFREDGLLHLGYQMIRKRHGEKVSFNKFEALCRGKKNQDGQSEDLKDSIEQILTAWRYFNKMLEDVGGSSTENDKSGSQPEQSSESSE